MLFPHHTDADNVLCRKKFSLISLLIPNQVAEAAWAKDKKTSYGDSGNKNSTGNGKSKVYLCCWWSLVISVNKEGVFVAVNMCSFSFPTV